MRLKRFLMLKKFQRRIFVWITLTFFILLITFSFFSYINIEKIVSKNVYKTNMEILSHAKFNVQLMDDGIKNLCKELFVNTNVSELMYSRDIDFLDSLSKMKSIELIAISNSFVDSVHIYNGNIGTLYSPGRSIIEDDKLFVEILSEIVKKEKIIPVLKPIILDRNIEGKSENKNNSTLSYFMYQYTDNNGIPIGAIIINIKSVWLLNNLEQIDKDKNNAGQVFAFNDKGVLINELEGNRETQDFIKALLKEYKDGKIDIDNTKGYIKRDIEGKSSIVTFLNVENAGLTLVRTQPYDDVFGMFNKMRLVLLLITLVFLIIVFTVSILISNAIYRPVGRLVSKVGNGWNTELEALASNDEMYYLEEVYKRSGDKIQKYETDEFSNRNTLRGFHLKKLLLNSSDFNNSDIDNLFIENNIDFSSDTAYSICVLKIDGYKEFQKINSTSDKALLKFAIINIMTEVIAMEYRNEGLDMDDDKVVFIINSNINSENEVTFSSNLENLIKQAQDHILNYYNISVSAAFSERKINWNVMTQIYADTLENSMYRLVYGNNSVINTNMTRANNQTEFSFDYKRMLIEGIKARDTKKVENVLNRLYKEASEFEYKSIIVSMLSVIETIEKSVSDVNSVSLEPVDIDFVSMRNSIFETESLEEFYRSIFTQVEMLCKEREKNIINVKHLMISEEIKEIVDNEFSDNSLCLSSIAARLKMSNGYVGKIFKDSVKMSINEYINEVRLYKAIDWLEKSNLNINEIIVKIGIENETYFYSLFKKKFGVTPKDYMLQKGINAKN